MKSQKGFTLIEFLVTSAIIIVISGVIYAVQRDLFSLNSFFGEALTNQRDAEAAIKDMVSELRAAAQGDTGAYTLEKTDPNSLAWYANIDSDAARERVQYFASGGMLWKSVVNPTGNPLTYATTTASESLRAVLRDLAASTTAPTFSYYPETYAGTSSPLVVPFSISIVRHVKITLIVDRDPNRLPPPIIVTSEVNIRNLKENY